MQALVQQPANFSSGAVKDLRLEEFVNAGSHGSVCPYWRVSQLSCAAAPHRSRTPVRSRPQILAHRHTGCQVAELPASSHTQYTSATSQGRRRCGCCEGDLVRWVARLLNRDMESCVAGPHFTSFHSVCKRSGLMLTGAVQASAASRAAPHRPQTSSWVATLRCRPGGSLMRR